MFNCDIIIEKVITYMVTVGINKLNIIMYHFSVGIQRWHLGFNSHIDQAKSSTYIIWSAL